MLIQGTHNLGSCSWRGLERSWLQESRTSWVHYRIIPWRQIVLLPISFIIECKWPFRIGLKCVCWFAQPQTELLDDPVTPLLSTYPKEVTASAWRGICASVQREALSAIAKRLKQPNCSSVGERIKKKKSVPCSYSGLLHSLQKEGNADACCNMEELWKKALC